MKTLGHDYFESHFKCFGVITISWWSPRVLGAWGRNLHHYLELSVFCTVANNQFLLLLHCLQRYTLNLAEILMEDELVIGERRRHVCLIHHQAAETGPPVGVWRGAALADSRVDGALLMSDAQVSYDKVSLVRGVRGESQETERQPENWLREVLAVMFHAQ